MLLFLIQEEELLIVGGMGFEELFAALCAGEAGFLLLEDVAQGCLDGLDLVDSISDVLASF